MKPLTNRAKILKIREAVEGYEEAKHQWNILDKSVASSKVNQTLADCATTQFFLIELVRKLVKE